MGQLKLAAVFSDGCVLQRGKTITVFGTGCEDTVVEAVLSGKVLGTDKEQISKGRGMVKNGRFDVLLPPLREGLEHSLTVTDGTTGILLEHLAIGEVWMAGGQSNMEMELQNCAEKDALNRPADPMLRFYYTQKRAYIDEAFLKAEADTAWECFGGQGTGSWSAVGYFFGEKLQKKLQVPVGIIGCNWGGTSASAWMPCSALSEDRDLKVYLDAYDEAVRGKTREEQIREYEEYAAYQAEFDRRAAEIYQKHPDMEWDEVVSMVGENRYPGPMGCINPYRPGGLYESMLKRIMPYTLKGFLYYQGESDDHQPRLYDKLLARLIRQWREDWGDDELAFLFVQLPMHRYRQDPDRKHWCLIREAQDRVYRTVRGTGMACAIDQGEFNEIHPKRKSIVGERLYYRALEVAYGMGCPEGKGPEFAWAEPGEGELILHIRGAGGGLLAGPEPREEDLKPGEKNVLFEIAGEDGAYVPADRWAAEEKDGETVVIIKSEKVSFPRYGRYLWTNYKSGGFLYGKNGMPLPPFRTDRRDGFTVREA